MADCDLYKPKHAQKVTLTVVMEHEGGRVDTTVMQVRPETFMLSQYRPAVRDPQTGRILQDDDTSFVMHGLAFKE